MDEVEADQQNGKDPQYPLKVLYCGVCGTVPELCEYNSPEDFEKCKPWLAVNAADLYPDLKLNVPEVLDEKMKKLDVKAEGGKEPTAKESKKKKKVTMEPEVVIQKSTRKGRKQVTVVYGLDLFGLKIPDVAKVCKKKFSCGASAVKAPDQRDTLEIQGDRVQTLAAFLRDDFKVPEGRIFLVDDDKAKAPAFEVVEVGES